MTKEALRLALEALEYTSLKWPQVEEAITAIKAALEAKDEPWSPVSIGVDVTKEGAHVVGIYALDADTSQIFYAKHHPVPQRTWVGLTDEEIIIMSRYDLEYAALIGEVQRKLKEKNT